MSARQSDAAISQRSAPTREAAPSTAPLVLPALRSGVTEAVSVILPSRHEKQSDTTSSSPSQTSDTRPANEQPQSSRSTWDWICDKAGKCYRAAAGHLSALSEVRDVSGFLGWAKNAAADLWQGLKATAGEIAAMVRGEETHAVASLEDESPFEEAIELSLEGLEHEREKKERKLELEEYYEEIRRQKTEKGESLGHADSHDLVHISPAFVDAKMIGDLKLAIMKNQVPPECMIEVRRFLAHVEAEEKAKRVA